MLQWPVFMPGRLIVAAAICGAFATVAHGSGEPRPNSPPGRRILTAPAESACTGVTNTDALGGLAFITFLDPIPYGCRIVDAADAHPVHDGAQSARFELHPDDCNSSPESPDCQTDRSRYEIFHNNRDTTTDGQVVRYEVWVYVPPQVRFRPRGGNIMFIDQMQYLPPDSDVGGVLAYLEVGEGPALMVRTHIGFTYNIQAQYRIVDDPVGRWTKIVWEIGSTSQPDGFLRVYVNDVLKVDETKPTLPESGWRHSLKIGIYNAFKSQATEPFDTQVVYFDGIGLSVTRFSDQPLEPGTTAIKAYRITELRKAIDALRARYSLDPFSWTEPTLTAGTSVVSAVHVMELRTALSAVYSAAHRPPPTFTDPQLDGSVAIKAAHIEELRGFVTAIE